MLSDQERHAEAEAAYRRAIELDRQFACPWNGLGNVLSDQKRHAEAEAAYRRAIELDPNPAVPLRNLGFLIEFDLQRPGDAAEMYLESVRRDPSYNLGLFNLRSICHKLASLADTRPTAESSAREGLALAPGDSGLQAALAHALIERDAWDEARLLVESWARGATAWHD
ncbi:MAG: tetratricopeptide repeat protein, partial [Polyangiaceae bacterium]|nr:tetratricopeptide repeat protein [Polyangiaceae bacterium]